MSFWDSSAIVPLCVNEGRSQSARRLWRLFDECHVWLETTVEVESSFARLEREGHLDSSSYLIALKQLKAFEERWFSIEPTSRVTELARSFPRKHGLKALDSLQLASALIWCREFPKHKNFVTADAKLAEAAEATGFSVHRLM